MLIQNAFELTIKRKRRRKRIVLMANGLFATQSILTGSDPVLGQATCQKVTIDLAKMILHAYHEDYGLVQYGIFGNLIQTLKRDTSQPQLQELIILEL